MNQARFWKLFSACAAAAFAVAVFVSCSTPGRVVSLPPEIEGAHYVGNAACVECHTNIVRSFPMSAHGKFTKDDVAFASINGCESCHGPASKHIQAGGGRGKFIANPGKDSQACLNCHLQTHAEFNLPQHHPVLEGTMNCVQCHDPHGHDISKPAGGLAMASLNQSCAQCHREQSKPFVFEHEAMRDGCTVCHNPHGSINRKLLVERDNNLCLKCHAQVAGPDAGGAIMIGKVPHSQFLMRGTCWSAGCHTAVHGSNVSPLMHF